MDRDKRRVAVQPVTEAALEQPTVCEVSNNKHKEWDQIDKGKSPVVESGGINWIDFSKFANKRDTTKSLDTSIRKEDYYNLQSGKSP